jgi:hypothetical protein
MKRLTFILSFLLVSFVSFSQKVLEDLKSYDYKQMENIIRDSIWPKPEVAKHCKFYDDKETANINFKVIPMCKFQKDTFTYIPNTSILHYIEIDTSFVYAFVLYNDILIGSLSGYKTNALPVRLEIDSTGDYIVPSPLEIKYGKRFRWEPGGNCSNLCLKRDAYISEVKLYNFLLKRKPKLFFFYLDFPGFFFIDENKLMAYSIIDEKVYEETELIKGIVKREYKKGEKIIGAKKHSTIGNKDI